MPQRNYTYTRREGEFSVVQVSFNLQRHTGYFLIQVYVPCILIVVLSWVSFWIHREATSDRVGLGITTVLTLSTIRWQVSKDTYIFPQTHNFITPFSIYQHSTVWIPEPIYQKYDMPRRWIGFCWWVSSTALPRCWNLLAFIISPKWAAAKCQCWSMTNGKIWWKRLNTLERCTQCAIRPRYRIVWDCRQPHAPTANAIRWFAQFIMWESKLRIDKWKAMTSSLSLLLFRFRGKGPIYIISAHFVSSVNYGANNSNRAATRQKMETNLVVFLGRRQISQTTTTRSHRKKSVFAMNQLGAFYFIS